MGTRKNFFEIYRQFGHAPSKRVASPRLAGWVGLEGRSRGFGDTKTGIEPRLAGRPSRNLLYTCRVQQKNLTIFKLK